MNKMIRPDIHIIQASAGSGKTYTLTHRIVDVIKAGNARPRGLVVTTFTRKAAAELTGRVRSALLAEGLRTEAQEIGQAYIGTVNSVCGRILREYAFECGLNLEQNVLSEENARTVFKEAIAQTLAKKARKEDVFAKINGVVNNLGLEKWRDLVGDIAGKARTNNIEGKMLPDQGKRVLDEIFSGIKQGADRSAEALELAREAVEQLETLRTDGKDDFKNTGDALIGLKRSVADLEHAGRPVWRVYAGMGKLAASKKSGADEMLAPLREAADTHHTWPPFRADMEDAIALLYELAGDTLREYQAIKEANGWIDFIDQETLCLQALDNPAVRAALTERLDMLFVDEFQDTSPIQMALFLRLAGLVNSSVWVGDPKQSIFGFRDTDPGLMLSAVARIMDGRNAEILSTSYRSRPGLVRYVNDSFKNAFSGQGMGPAQIVLNPDRPVMESPGLESWVLTKQGNRQNIDTDIQLIVREIGRILANPDVYPVPDRDTKTLRPIRAGDIAVLARKNDTCLKLAGALDEHGLPVELGTAGLLRRPAVRACIDGLRLVLNPDDAMAAAGISYIARQAADPDSRADWMTGRIKSWQMDDEAPPWQNDERVAVVRDHVSSLQGMSPAGIVHRLADILGVWEYCSRAVDPRREIANLDSFLNLVGTYEAEAVQMGQGVSVAGCLDYLRNLEANGDDTLAVMGMDAVRISTWHKAKGLEWPMTVLYELDRDMEPPVFSTRTRSERELDLRNPLSGRQVFCCPSPYGNTRPDTMFTDELKAADWYFSAMQNIHDENVRLLYVALTRARDYLVFAARPDKLTFLQKATDLVGTPTIAVPQNPDEVPGGWQVRLPVLDELAASAAGSRAGPDRRWYTYPGKGAFAEAAYSASEIRVPESLKGRVKAFHAGNIQNLTVPTELDHREIGNSVHNIMAVRFKKPNREVMVEAASRIIKAHGLGKTLDPALLSAWADGFHSWIAEKWPGYTAWHEVPVACNIAGRRIHGFTDLVLSGPDGLVILDYKIFTGSAEQARKKAVDFTGQVAVYAETASRQLKVAVKGMYVVFPVSGAVIGLEVDDRPAFIRQCLETA